MDRSYKRSAFIFRRDLRIDDNTGLIAALEHSEEVIPCFILDPRQIEKNPYFSQNAFQFMIESLEDIEKQLNEKGGNLHVFHGEAHQVIRRLIEEEGVEAIFVNRDYTPFSRKRDEMIKQACKSSGIDFIQSNDLLLHEPEDVKSQKGKPYTVFTPFFRSASKIPVDMPRTTDATNFFTGQISMEKAGILKKALKKTNDDIRSHGGRKNAMMILGQMERFENYEKERDFPAMDSTTGLSAHNKFGTVSIREVYHSIIGELGPSHTLVAQLYWRDFFTHLAYHYPHVFGHSFRRKYEKLEWENDPEKFEAWCQGKTGFPIVDAGMRELNTTGYMHNRVRMIVASFLVKDLHIDWKWGERYFARKLVDYDPCINNGNWQWAASTGSDSQPYFRIFNPWLQQKKFDKNCEYIKRWIKELEEVDARNIHALEKNEKPISGYPEPIVEHGMERDRTLLMFRSHIDNRESNAQY